MVCLIARHRSGGIDANSVDFKLTTAEGASLGWQPAYSSGVRTPVDEAWYIEYAIPQTIGDPTGSYTLTGRVRDTVGNSAEYSTTITVALPESDMSVNAADSQAQVYTQTIAISGEVTSTQGINTVEVAFVSIAQINALSGTVAILNLDEPAGSVWFNDNSQSGNHAYCDTCPTLRSAGIIYNSAAFR
jgi:hypothetical protein